MPRCLLLRQNCRAISPPPLSLILINGCLCYAPAWMGRATLLNRPKRGLRSCNLKQFWGSVPILLFSIVSDPTVKIFPWKARGQSASESPLCYWVSVSGVQTIVRVHFTCRAQQSRSAMNWERVPNPRKSRLKLKPRLNTSANPSIYLSLSPPPKRRRFHQKSVGRVRWDWSVGRSAGQAAERRERELLP